mmetsp:Transcript_22027/g.35442  ORF Transcript_22027/g.35442 Transcript_22027/m.35442 type:complete len:227 (+) Transcript_22027:569-1249(+)
MTREMTLMQNSANGTAMSNMALKTFATPKTLTKTTNNRRRNNSNSPTMSNVNRPTSTTTVVSSRKKKLNTLLDPTAQNKGGPSSLVFSPMIHAQPLLMTKAVPALTVTWLESLFLTPTRASSPWTASPAKNLKTSTTMETMPKMRTKLSRCANKSTAWPESANRDLRQLATSTKPTTTPATTLLESRLSARTVSSPKLDPRPTRLLPSSLASSWLPLCFWLPTSTT